MNLVVDTNIVLYFLGGNQRLVRVVKGFDLLIPFVVEIELLSYPFINRKEENSIKRFLDDCLIVDLNQTMKMETISLRRAYGLKVPDALVASTALYYNAPLLSADKGFKKVKELNF